MAAAALLVTAAVPWLGALLNILTYYAIEAHIVLARLGWIWWFAWLVCLVSLAVVPTHLLPETAGSGIPQLRAVFSGARMPGFLRARLLPLKFLSSAALVSSGVFVGFEGPMVHMGALVAGLVAQLPPLRRIRESPELRATLVAVGGGAGLACTLGAPIGGVLYTIEEVASSYRITQLWYAFLAGVPGAVAFRLLMSWWQAAVTGGLVPYSPLAGLLEPRLLLPFAFGPLEFFWAALLGLLGGLSGIAFVGINSCTVRLTRRLAGRFPLCRHHLLFAACVALVSSLLFYPAWTGDFACLGPYSVLRDLTAPGDVFLVERGWTFIDVRASLALFFLLKLPLLAVSIALPASTGFYFATMGCGAALGRLWGILWLMMLPEAGVTPDIFALIGAAAVGAAVTQSVSTIVIVLELSGRMPLLVPLIVAVLPAVGVARLGTRRTGIYERMALNLGLSFVPDLQPDAAALTVAPLIQPLARCLRLGPEESLPRLAELAARPAHAVFPVVGPDALFLGFLSIVDLNIYLRRLKRLCNVLPPPVARDEDAEAVDVCRAVGRRLGQLHISKGFIELSPSTPLPVAHMLFMRVGEDMMPVTADGRLLGIVTREDFAAFLHGHNVRHEEEQQPDIEQEWIDRQIHLGHGDKGIFM